MNQIKKIFSYQYNINIFYLLLITINILINILSSFEQEDYKKAMLESFAIVFTSLMFSSPFVITLFHRKKRRDVLYTFGVTEIINKFDICMLSLLLLTTSISVLNFFHLFDLYIKEYMVEQYKDIIPMSPYIILSFIGIISMKNLFLLINPQLFMDYLVNIDKINDLLKSDIVKIRSSFSKKDIIIKMNLKDNLSFYIDSIDYDELLYCNEFFFAYKKFILNKNDFYNYLQNANIKIDQMIDDDWVTAEMFCIN